MNGHSSNVLHLHDEVQGLYIYNFISPTYAQRGEKVFVKSGNCHIEHTATFCLCYAVVFLYLTSYAYVHLTLYKDVFS